MVRKGAWGTMMFFVLIVAAYALANAFVPGIRDGFIGRLFAERPLPTLGHLAGGGIAIVAGALQFTRLRWTRPSVHRLLGRVYVVAVLVSGSSALLMAPFSEGGPAGHFGFGMLGVLWLASTLMAYTKVRAHDFVAHREWMIRSYALCLAAVTLRIYLPLGLASGVEFDQIYPAIAWLCWVPNLVVAEWMVLKSTLAPLEPPPARA